TYANAGRTCIQCPAIARTRNVPGKNVPAFTSRQVWKNACRFRLHGLRIPGKGDEDVPATETNNLAVGEDANRGQGIHSCSPTASLHTPPAPEERQLTRRTRSMDTARSRHSGIDELSSCFTG